MAASATKVTAYDCSTDKEIAPANDARESVYVLNDSATATLYLRLGSSAATSSDYSEKLAPGDAATIGPNEYAGPVHAVWSAADAVGKVRVTEMV